MGASPEDRATRWSAVRETFPILTWMPEYRREHLRGDVFAGAIVASLLIPQSLGYARIAGVPVQVGLYAVPLALLAYAIFGSSPHLSVGPASTVAIVSGSLVADIANGDPAQALAVTAALAVMTGLVLVAIGLLRVAWVAEFLSKPIVTGFVFGLTLTIIIGELPTLLGIDKPPGDLLGVLVRTVVRIGDLHVPITVIGIIALVALFGGKHYAPRVPWGLVTLVFAVTISSLGNLSSRCRHGRRDTWRATTAGHPRRRAHAARRDRSRGHVTRSRRPRGGPRRLTPLRGPRRLQDRDRTRTDRDGRGEHRGRTVRRPRGCGQPVKDGRGCTGWWSQPDHRPDIGGSDPHRARRADLVLHRPAQSRAVGHRRRSRVGLDGRRRDAAVPIRARADFAAAIVAALGVVLFGPLPGLGVAIAVSLLAIIYRASFPRIEVLGKIKGEKAAWGRVRGHPQRQPVDGIVVIRLDAPLFWVNATAIEDRVLAELDEWPDTRAVVINLEATTRLDTTSADVLVHLLAELRKRDVELYLARVLHPAQKVLERAGFVDDLGVDHMWHSISQAVRAARRDTGLKRGKHDQTPTVPDAEIAAGLGLAVEMARRRRTVAGAGQRVSYRRARRRVR